MYVKYTKYKSKLRLLQLGGNDGDDDKNVWKEYDINNFFIYGGYGRHVSIIDKWKKIKLTNNKNLQIIKKGLLYGNIDIMELDLFALSNLTQVEESFLMGCSGLTLLDLSNIRLTQVGDNFLDNCKGLTELTLPNSLIQVGHYFLYNCNSLTSLDLSNIRLTQVRDFFLMGCSGLTSLDLSNIRLTQIGDHFLQDCSGLTSLDLPDGLTQVGNDFLSHCSDLTSLKLPNSLTQVGYNFLAFCSKLDLIHCTWQQIDIILSPTLKSKIKIDKKSFMQYLKVNDNIDTLNFDFIINSLR